MVGVVAFPMVGVTGGKSNGTNHGMALWINRDRDRTVASPVSRRACQRFRKHMPKGLIGTEPCSGKHWSVLAVFRVFPMFFRF